jgi:AbrB family looped-hinge helix DNA binding protein
MSEQKTYYKTRLRGRGQITLPPEIRDRLGVNEGDDVLFYVNETGQVVVEQAQIIDPEQAWFWTQKWQQAERESREDYEKGEYFEFDNTTQAIRFLDELDAEDAKRHAEDQV